MESSSTYRCPKCGWEGKDTEILLTEYSSPEAPPRCPKCFGEVKKAEKAR